MTLPSSEGSVGSAHLPLRDLVAIKQRRLVRRAQA
jgi:hypothetical protein